MDQTRKHELYLQLELNKSKMKIRELKAKINGSKQMWHRLSKMVSAYTHNQKTLLKMEKEMEAHKQQMEESESDEN